MENMKGQQNNFNNTLVLDDIEEASHSYEIQSIGNATTRDEIVDKNRIDLKKVSMAITFDDKENNSITQRNAEIQDIVSIKTKGFCEAVYTFITNIFFYVKIEPNSYLNGLIGIAVIVGISALTLAFTCWPQHNVILYPEYWYESIMPTDLTQSLCIVAMNITYARIILKANEILTLRAFWFHYFFCVSSHVVIFISIYSIWVKYLSLPHPMPLTGTINALLMSFVVVPLANWLLFALQMKNKNNPLRKKIFSWITLGCLRTLMAIKYGFILSLPLVKQEDLQLGLGVLFPALETFNMWWNSKFTRWAFDCDLETAAIENVIAVQVTHSFTLTIVLGSSHINPWTTYVLIFADTLVNGWSVRNIIRNNRIGTEHATNIRDHSLKLLALKEFLEILVPAVYCLSFAGSYLGPNYDIMGGIGSNHWHHERISSLYEKLKEISTFMIAESIRGVAFTFLLWKFFGLSMYSAYCDVIRKYGFYILVVGASVNISVSIYYLFFLKYKIENKTVRNIITN